MPLNWITLIAIASLATIPAACTPSPQQFLPADPLAGASGVVVHIGGCSAATSPCPQ
jgi:hypothetical protein